MTPRKQRIVVAMSGGVDSSVTAALLKSEGHEVIGISMQVWDHSRFFGEEKAGSCCSLDDIHDARRVAEQLQIPFYVVNFEEEFQRLVIDDFVDEYFNGRTPNPCVRCNQLVKFELLLEKALELGADSLATGHYARIIRGEDGLFRLYKGLDPGKDQSYFLFTLTQGQLSRTLFPLGGMTKAEVRRLASRFELRVAEKGESQEICFIPDNDYVRFISEERDMPDLSGNIVDTGGRVLGRHDGTFRYTVGQRRGLGVAHPHPLYVVRIHPERREVVVGGREELLSDGLVAGAVRWTAAPPEGPVEAECKIRYRHHPVSCTIIPLGEGKAAVAFRDREKSVTPGQAVVFYRGDEVIGGGWIEAAGMPESWTA